MTFPDVSLVVAGSGTDDSKAGCGVKGVIAAATYLPRWGGMGVQGMRRTRGMLVHWMTDGDGLHYAARLLGARGTLHMLVDSLSESGWDWQVWEQLGRGQQRYGLADTLDEAKARAEGALSVLMRELGLVVQVPVRPPHFQS